MDIFKDRIAPLIIRARESGKTDAEMERSMGLPVHSINKWFTGKYKSYKNYLPQIASYFRVSVSYLLGEAEDRAPAPTNEDGLAAKVSLLPFALQEKFLRFLELAAANPDTAERFLDFAVIELETALRSD